jgi:hypothetical protein
LGLLYFFQKKYAESQKVYQRALDIRLRALRAHDPAVAETMNSYASVLRALHREAEASQMETQAQAIQAGK